MRKITLLVALFFLSVVGFAQTMELTFVGCDTSRRYVKLDSVKIYNHTQGWQEVLFYPDTILRIQNTIGIENYEFESQFALSQNVPNPFDGKTQVSLSLPEGAQVKFFIFDVNGKRVAARSFHLSAGTHLFQIELSKAQPYFLTARTSNHSSTIKMLNSGSGNGNTLSYMGSTDRGECILKSDVERPVSIGDEMEYVGYATVFDTLRESIHVMKELQGSELVPIPFEISFFSCPDSYMVDYDDNVYTVVPIGSQCWMKENLRTTRYADGTPIAYGTESTVEVPLRLYPNGDSSNVGLYGYLYNWKAVMNSMPSSDRVPSNVQGVCPDHWHVPSDAEWQMLEIHAGLTPEEAASQGERGIDIAVSFAGTLGWEDCGILYGNCPGNPYAQNRNSTGFSALPAGSHFYSWFHCAAFFWTCTADVEGSWERNLSWRNGGIDRSSYERESFYSVRCVYGDPEYVLPTVTTRVTDTIYPYFATFGGTLVDNGGSIMSDYGVVYSDVPDFSYAIDTISMVNQSSAFSQTINGLTPATTYYVKAYAVNLAGVSYGDVVSFTTPAVPGNRCLSAPTVTDWDGNIYSTEQIGSQCWMKENLRTKHTSQGELVCFLYPNQDNNLVDTSLAAPYGLLYTWAVVMNGELGSSSVPSGVQGICPEGWHVPSDAEWMQLEIYAGMDPAVAADSEYRSDIAVTLCDTLGWLPCQLENVPGNREAHNRNVTGFSARPAGLGDGSASWSSFFGEMSFFWTSSEKYFDVNENGFPWYRAMRNTDSWVARTITMDNWDFCLSVRCVKDE